MSARLIETRREDGALVLRAPVALPDDRPDILDRLAAADPHKVLMTAPGPEGRDSLTYGAALAEARQLRDWLVMAHGLRPGARVATLLPAGIAALRLRLACLCGGFTHVALPPFPFRDPGGEEAARLLAIAKPDLLVIPPGHPAAGLVLPDLPPPAPARADHPAQPGDMTAIFFTAGSTGAAKGVAVTRGQISACQAAAVALWPFLAEGPVLIDWMPWNHVFGGLDNLFKVIWNGGTLHLDRPPSAHTISATLDLMEAVRPTLYIGVPLGMKLLLAAFEAEPDRLPRTLSRLRHVFLAGAAIEPTLWDRLAAFAGRCDPPIALLSGYGATETGSTMCLSPGGVDRPGLLGWPLPGHEVALCPVEDRTEIRFRGPVLGPAYLTGTGETPLPLDDFDSIAPATPGFSTPRRAACASTGGCPRISSWRAGSRCAPARCAARSSAPAAPTSRTWCWAAPDARRSRRCCSPRPDRGATGSARRSHSGTTRTPPPRPGLPRSTGPRRLPRSHAARSRPRGRSCKAGSYAITPRCSTPWRMGRGANGSPRRRAERAREGARPDQSRSRKGASRSSRNPRSDFSLSSRIQ